MLRQRFMLVTNRKRSVFYVLDNKVKVKQDLDFEDPHTARK